MMHRVTGSIGGYFELELNRFEPYHKSAISLNTGRNALELILMVKKYKKIYIPYFTCEAILEPIKKLDIQYDFYTINSKLEPVFDFDKINNDEGFLYTNYFGLKDFYITKLSEFCKNLIVDNSQAFFSFPVQGVPTFYSCRKFFGVPDGAYVYIDDSITEGLEMDYSGDRLGHLIKRIEYGAESGYGFFVNNDKKLSGQPMRLMSNLTHRLLSNIDYSFISNKRNQNFNYLHQRLRNINKLEFSCNLDSIAPMVYPLLIDSSNIKDTLIENRIFVATYWPNVLEWCNAGDFEYGLTTNLLNLPIDQRYGEDELAEIVSFILKFNS